jgi:hypothetical protein
MWSIGVADRKQFAPSIQGEAVEAIVGIKAGTDADADDIIDWTKSRIAGFIVPKRADVIAELRRYPP